MDLIRLLADPEDDTLPPPPPLLKGGEFPIQDLLLDLKYQRQKAKRREAAYLSVICHFVILLLLLSLPKWPDWLHLTPITPMHRALPDQDWFNPKNMTYLEMPKDLITKQPPKNPQALSDQDRHFEQQDKITNSISSPIVQPKPIPKPPGSPAPPAPTPQPSQPAPAATSQPAPADATNQPAPKAADNGLKLEDIPKPNPVNRMPLGTLSASESIQRALQAVAENHGDANREYDDFGQLPRRSNAPAGTGSQGQGGTTTRILTDTQGVDFSSYLQRVIDMVRQNWYAVMPETVWLGTRGRDVVIFNINANGTVAEVQLVSPSGTQSLDQAALASINASNPFPPLPAQFHGPFIKLQFGYFYNLTPADH